MRVALDCFRGRWDSTVLVFNIRAILYCSLCRYICGNTFVRPPQGSIYHYAMWHSLQTDEDAVTVHHKIHKEVIAQQERRFLSQKKVS
ncbi:hypothetical protein OESDEN_18371 [Oesophagostomum dentatum]|uniref:Uncharacterized protein n=1 Tax=Oesophagostomum dentatum TaxID=61180 RepID=A0A0B1SFE1_OESDE|nr:hypothetical protein OESDEN_18371 [Oesophagostomum dentatum]